MVSIESCSFRGSIQGLFSELTLFLKKKTWIFVFLNCPKNDTPVMPRLPVPVPELPGKCQLKCLPNIGQNIYKKWRWVRIFIYNENPTFEKKIYIWWHCKNETRYKWNNSEKCNATFTNPFDFIALALLINRAIYYI